MATPAPLGLPLEEATYATPAAVKAALQSHARDNGYGVSVSLEEVKQMEDDEAEEALSQAIEAFVAPTRTGLKRTATLKVVDNVKQARCHGLSQCRQYTPVNG